MDCYKRDRNTMKDIIWHIAGSPDIGWRVVAENKYVRVEVKSKDLHKAIEEAKKGIIQKTCIVTGETYPVTLCAEDYLPFERRDDD